MNEETDTTVQGFAKAVAEMENGLHDAKTMASIVSILIEDSLPRADLDGFVMLGEQRAEAITWAVYNVEHLIKKAQAEWGAANTIGFKLRRAAR